METNVVTTPALQFVLSFLLVFGTRGEEGVAVVCNYILGNWEDFTIDWPKFCRGLVLYCKAACETNGSKTYLSHREGRLAGLSGINFIRTLERSICRKNLVCLANVFEKTVARIFKARGRTQLLPAEIIEFGKSMKGRIYLAIQKGKMKAAGRYNAMSAARALEGVCEIVLGCKPAQYNEELHNWYVHQQGYSYAKMLKYFGTITRVGMIAIVKRLQKTLGKAGTVTQHTVYVLMCDTKQAINRYTHKGLNFLVETYAHNQKSRDLVDKAREQLQKQVSFPHTLVLLETVRKYLGMSLASIKKTRSCRLISTRGIMYKLGRWLLCPKVIIEGIPEAIATKKCMTAVYGKI